MAPGPDPVIFHEPRQRRGQFMPAEEPGLSFLSGLRIRPRYPLFFTRTMGCRHPASLAVAPGSGGAAVPHYAAGPAPIY